jgi:hypothetical protein
VVGSKILKVLVVDEYLHKVGRTFSKYTLFLKSIDDSYQFLMVDSVIAFDQKVLFGEEYNWVENTVFIILEKDTPRDIVRCICLNNYLGIMIKVMKNGYRREYGL